MDGTMEAWLRELWRPTAAMIAVVVASNLLVQFAINDWLTWGAFSYPLSFLVTDLTNRRYGPRRARQVVGVGFVCAVALSIVVADARIAFASGAAYLAAQLLDIAIFDRLRRQAWWQAPFVSSVVSSALDTALFFGLAFAGTGVPWVTLAIGDYLVKLGMAAVCLAPYRAFVSLVTANWARPAAAR